MTAFEVGSRVLIPALHLTYHPHPEYGSVGIGDYRYEEVLEAGEIVTLFRADDRPAAVIYNFALDKPLEYFLDGSIELDNRSIAQ